MKKMSSISVLIIISILIVSVIHITGANTVAIQTSVPTGVFAQVPLSNSQISTIWPDLPSVQTLEQLNCTFTYNSADFGQTSMSPLQSNPTGRLLPFTVTNYTTYVPCMETGTICLVSNIWLQMNATEWIQVPIDLLMSTNNTDIPSPPTAIASSTPQGVQSPNSLVSNWAIGLYSNPATIDPTSPVLGAFSFGQFPTNFNPQSGAFLWSDILSVYDGDYIWQIGMILQQGQNPQVIVEGWKNGLQYYDPYYVSMQYDQFYSEYIQYNPYISNPCWQFYWNQQNSGFQINDGKTSIISGNQPNVCAESNDGNNADFNNCYWWVGGYSGEYYLAAIGYVYGETWTPVYPGDPVPYAWSYLGGNQILNNLDFAIGAQPPTINFGCQVGLTETLQFGPNIIYQQYGTVLWT